MSVGTILTTWTGGPSSPGYSVLNIDTSGAVDADAAVAAVRQFWFERSVAIPDEYTLQVDPFISDFNEGTGTLQGFIEASAAPAAVPGQSAEDWAAGVGMRIEWRTSAIRNGRRVRGSTFLVPVAITTWLPDGSVDPASVAAVNASAQTLIDALAAAGAPLVIWSKPSASTPVGDISLVSTPAASPKTAVLRGRRDP